MLKLDRSSTQAVFVENYKIRFSKYDYMHMLMYLCRVSFLTTIDIYKTYFKGHRIMHRLCKLYAKRIQADCDLVHYSL